MRKKKVIKRHTIKPDQKFNSTVVAQLINKIMRKGEKRIAARIVYQAAEIVEKWFKGRLGKPKEEKKLTQKVAEVEKAGEKIPPPMKKVRFADEVIEADREKELLKTDSAPFLTVLEGSLANVKPSLETRSRKYGSSTRRIPVKVEERRALTLASRWIVESAKTKRAAKPMFEKLAEEIIEAYNKTGAAFKKKENIHKEALGNMEFAASF